MKNLVSRSFPASKIHPPSLSYFLLWILIATQVLYPVLAQAGTVSGQIQTATGGAVTNGTLNFTLNQAAILPGTALIASSQTSCYTSNLGNVVGVPDPIVPPSLSTNLVTGTLPAGTYFVKITYVSSTGESQPSPEQTINLSAQGTLIVAPPVLQPPTETAFNIYISATSNTEQLQGTSTGFTSFSRSVPLGVGAIPPLANTSSCQVRFSDELIPSGTYYKVSLLNKNGSQISGFPQNWCLYGGPNGNDNVSQGAPTGLCNVIYPTPIVSIPIFNAPQNISGPLSLNSYGLTAGFSQFIGALSSSQPYHINFTTGAAGGGFLYSSGGGGNANFAGGASFNGANTVAQAAGASILAFNAGGWNFDADNGLAVGNTYTPTPRFGIQLEGATPTFMPFLPQGFLDMTNAGSCSANLSAANHGIICYDLGSQSYKISVNGGAYAGIAGAAGYSAIKINGGASLAAQSTLNFITGAGAMACVNNAGASRTDCSVFQTSSTVGSGVDFTLTSNSGYGATGSNPFLAFSNANVMTLQSGVPSNNASSDSLNILTPNASPGANSGGNINITGGNGTTTGNGANVNVTAGNGGNGAGAITLAAGAATANGVVGGAISLQAGATFGGNTNGNSVFIQGANPQGSGIGGGLDIIVGSGNANKSGFVAIHGTSGAAAPSTATSANLSVDSATGRLKVNEGGDSRGNFFVTSQGVFSSFCSGTASAGAILFTFGGGATAITCTDTTKLLSTPMPSAGILRNLNVVAGTAGAAAGSGIVTILNGAGATALTCTVGTGTTCSDTTHTATVAKGDLISVQVVTAGGETLANVRVTYEKQ